MCNEIDPIIELKRLKLHVLSSLLIACKWFMVLHIEMIKDSLINPFFFRNVCKVLLRNDQMEEQFEDVKRQILQNIENLETRGELLHLILLST